MKNILRNYREKNKLSMVEMANKIGVSYTTYNRWERGQCTDIREKNMSSVKKLANYIGVSEQEILNHLVNQNRAEKIKDSYISFLKARRRTNNQSIADIASLANVDTKLVEDIELGVVRTISAEEVGNLAMAYDCTIDELISAYGRAKKYRNPESNVEENSSENTIEKTVEKENTDMATIDGVTLDNELKLIDMDQFVRIDIDGVIIRGRVAEIKSIRCYDVFKRMTVCGIYIVSNLTTTNSEIMITIK